MEALDWFLTTEITREEEYVLWKSIRHADTQEEIDSWRIQLGINFRVFPDAVNLVYNFITNKNTCMANFANDDEVLLTFKLPKKCEN